MSALEDSMSESPPADIARMAGRGTIYITAAKVWFMVSGFGIHLTLPRLMSDEEFGLYQVVVGVVSIINAVVIAGIHQTVSKHVSQEEEKADSVKRQALKLQSLVGGGATLAFVLAAPIVAGYLNDDRLAKYLRLASLITLFYSFYAVFTGYLNGRRRFLAQAAVDATYSTLKLTLIVLLAALGYGVAGGITGFVLAAAAVLVISAVTVGRGDRHGEVGLRQLFSFQLYLLAFTLVLNLLQKTDLMLIKALSSLDPEEASRNAAYYGAAANMANLVYQAIISMNFVVFPLVSKSTFAKDPAETGLYISSALRYALMIMAVMASLLSANATEVLAIVYPEQYKAGGGALGLLAWGMLGFGLLYVLTTVISASGRPAISCIAASITLAASAALNSMLIPRYGLVGAALATSVSMGLGVLVCGGYVLLRFGVLAEPLSVARICASAAAVYVLSRVVSAGSRLLTLAELVLMGLVYGVLLIISGELGRKEIDAINRIVGRKGGRPVN